jgi:cytochrome c-type biogenesis protein CcmF
LKFAALAAVAVGLAAWVFEDRGAVLACLAFGLATWLLVGTLSELAERISLFRAPLGESLRRAGRLPRAHYGMTLAHAGLAIVIFGVTASSAWKQEEVLLMRPGETVTLAGYDYRFEGVERTQGPNYRSDMATFEVTRDGAPVATLTPEKRLYPVQNVPTTEAAIHTTGLADLYAVIGDPQDPAERDGAWTVRLYHEPLVPWMWAGALIMMLGGLVSLSDRRLRVGMPARRRKTVPAGAKA